MSEIKVNKISPRTNCGTTTLGDSGDTFTIPSGVSITNQGTASGFGSTGEVSWVTTAKTTTFTVTAGEGYFCDTSSGGFTVNLPAGTAGASFAVADYTNTFQTGNLTISPNGSQKIGGVAANTTLSTEGQSAYFVYVDDTEGWKNVIDSTSNVTGQTFIVGSVSGSCNTLTNAPCGNYKLATFKGPGTFTVCSVASSPACNEVEYIIVAGGGGGSRGSNAGGGGGGGGFRFAAPSLAPLTYPAKPLAAPAGVTVTAQGYPIVVGGGGAGAAGNGSTGVASSGLGLTSAGGGAGGSCGSGANGGSGGGGGSAPGGAFKCGGSGNTPSVSPAQGNDGGRGRHTPPVSEGGGGGGGATAAGSDGDFPVPNGGGGGAGGAGGGFPTLFGTNGNPSGGFQNFSGGAGGSGNTAGAASPCGSGAAGGTGPGGDAPSASAFTGGGGGGGQNPRSGGNGGSGIVIIRYKFQ